MAKTSFTRISDLHLTDPTGATLAQLAGKRLFGYLSWLKNRRHEHRRDILHRLIEALKKADQGPVLVTGDLTQIGLPFEFEAALGILDQLGPPERVFVVPGNHDSYARHDLAATYGVWRDYLGGLKLEIDGPRVERSGPVEFIGLDSALPTAFFRATGRIGPDQLEALGACLRVRHEEPTFRVLYLHHPPDPRATRWRKRLVDGDDLLALLRNHRVDLVLHGHEHVRQSTTIESCGRDVPVLGIASASALGRRGKERRAAFHRHVVELKDGRWLLAVTEHAYDPATGQVGEVQSWNFEIPLVSA